MSARLETLHRHLGETFFDPVEPARFPEHILRYRNRRAAETIGLDGLSDAQWINHFGRFQPFPGSFEQPLALRYHGHQFRVYNPDIGDGRGFLFAQIRDLADGRLLDMGTKGSGRTPYSRSGDGRLTLKGGVREVLATARLEALGVYTSKSLSLIETGEALERHDEPSPTRSAVLVRLSHSHIRIGSFQRLAVTEDRAGLERLIDYCCQHYYPEIIDDSVAGRALSLFCRITAESARLCAQWMVAGFVHGVLNTDNLNITGESFDYGPYRFLPIYEPGFTAAYFDETGLYAYGRQPEAVHWNLCRLAECLLGQVERDALTDGLAIFDQVFEPALHDMFCRRLGLIGEGQNVAELIRAVFQYLHASKQQPDQFFHDWFGGVDSAERAMAGPDASLYQNPGFEPVQQALAGLEPHPAVAEALATDIMQNLRPVTLLYDEIEALWQRIAEDDDWSGFERRLAETEALRAAMAPFFADQLRPWPIGT